MKVDQFMFSEVSSCVFIFSNGERTVIRPSSGEDIMMVKFRPSQDNNDFQKMVMKYFLESNTVAQLAEKCGYTCLKSFTRHFKKNFNNTPYKWMLDRRLDESRHYVLESDLTITDIAEICNFTNISHFVNLYSKRFEVTPSKDRATKNRETTK